MPPCPKRSAWPAALLIAALAAQPATAATLELRITDRDGKPAADVVVLVEVPVAAVSATVSATATPQPAEPVTILQQGSRFEPALTVVRAGSTVRFVNHDSYDHHVRSVPSGPLAAVAPARQFELRQGPAGHRRKADSPPAVNEERFDAPGPVGLGCHLHSTMRGHIYVAATPYFGKTDEHGAVRLLGLPEGRATLRLWHAEQLLEQPAQPIALGAGPLALSAGLNFTPAPRRRR
jgi:plastocyanin